MNERGESDFASYVYLCYFNPYETNNDCNIVGDLNVYYKDILNDKELDVENFKKIMKYIDSVLEQSDIPNFSIIFHTFDPIREIIDFNVEINLNKQDELNLIKQGIKNPNIFILSNIINSLKKSVFVLGNDVDAKTITVNTRNIIDGNTSYTVTTSQKAFSLPIQKSSEREIFDYINSSFLEKLEKGRQALDLSEDEGIKEFTEKDEKSDEELEDEITFDEEDEDDDEDEDETDDEGLSNDEDNEDDTNNDSNNEGDENEESEDLTTDNVAEFTEEHGSADDLSLETLDFEDEDLFDDEDELNDEDD
ncbi:MAG: hypothetical protein K6E76_08330 [Patescibacteria group bacterium]|nr:hypothetical protein [Patescibacteria group bacterium]